MTAEAHCLWFSHLINDEISEIKGSRADWKFKWHYDPILAKLNSISENLLFEVYNGYDLSSLKCHSDSGEWKQFIVEYSRCEHPVKAIKMIDANKLQCLCLPLNWLNLVGYPITGIKRHLLSENKIDDGIYACTMYNVHKYV